MDKEKVSEDDVGIKARSVLWYLTFIGFAMNYMIRININIAIVDMISPEFKSKAVTSSECFSTNITMSKNESLMFDHSARFVSFEKRILDYFGVEYERDGFKWDAKTQAEVLAAFFTLHFATQLPGGILAQKFGTKLIFGFSNFFGCITCMLVPIAAYYSFYALFWLRLVQGFVAGAAWPAMSHLVGRWIPPNERSKFVTAYIGSSIGVSICYPIFGFIIQNSSWENVFHFCGIVGTIWYVLWQYFVYDSPESHPRIHEKEKLYILQSLGSSVVRGEKPKYRTPWKAILTSIPMWMNIVAQWGGVWGLFTLIAQAPTYFRFVHGWGIEMTGVLSGFPHLLRVIFSLIVSTFSDYLLSTNKMSRTNVRKMASFICLILNGFFVIGLAFSGCDVFIAVLLLTISLMLHGSVSSGALASVVDISPNFAGVSLGINSTFSTFSGFISPMIVGYLTSGRQHNVEPWKYVFLICATMQITCGIIYILFSDSTLQPWNKPIEEEQKAENVMEIKTKKLDKNFNEKFNRHDEERLTR
ncbi:unnamed protein product [Chironomus riparius]|uniref:Major facilitator superfamily (MFS) profile domain-containing protein n=1 Tax=Chironomus riparius TaxID=315576 RepID=A0A9N9RN02_9DIPT|nr:unnamed protein product [Chironomus riparius]